MLRIRVLLGNLTLEKMEYMNGWILGQSRRRTVMYRARCSSLTSLLHITHRTHRIHNLSWYSKTQNWGYWNLAINWWKHHKMLLWCNLGKGSKARGEIKKTIKLLSHKLGRGKSKFMHTGWMNKGRCCILRRSLETERPLDKKKTIFSTFD